MRLTSEIMEPTAEKQIWTARSVRCDPNEPVFVHISGCSHKDFCGAPRFRKCIRDDNNSRISPLLLLVKLADTPQLASWKPTCILICKEKLMRNKTGVLSAAGVGATIAMMIPPSVGVRTRDAIMTGLRSTWRFVSSPFAKRRTKPTRKRATRKRAS